MTKLKNKYLIPGAHSNDETGALSENVPVVIPLLAKFYEEEKSFASLTRTTNNSRRDQRITEVRVIGAQAPLGSTAPTQEQFRTEVSENSGRRNEHSNNISSGTTRVIISDNISHLRQVATENLTTANSNPLNSPSPETPAVVNRSSRGSVSLISSNLEGMFQNTASIIDRSIHSLVTQTS